MGLSRSAADPTSTRWCGLETCGSVWACPVCSARVLAQRSAELTTAVTRADERGDRIAMVTLTMRHRAHHPLQTCWDGLSDAWAAATGRNRAVRTAKLAADVQGWVRRVECTWGETNGWHVHVHALVLVRRPEHVEALGHAMFAAWAARLARVGLTPVRDAGGLDVRLLDVTAAAEEVGAYVAKGTYESTEPSAAAALELAGAGKHARRGNLTPFELLDRARAGDRRARNAWREWELASHGRRAITWSRGLRDALDLDAERPDDDVAADQADDEIIAAWPRTDWPAIRDLPPAHREMLLQFARVPDAEQAFDLVYRGCQMVGVPLPRPGPAVSF